jgi:hypothetical protein
MLNFWFWPVLFLHFPSTMPPPLLFCGLSLLLSTLSALADPSAGSALYPPGLQPLINRANALLSAGTFHDAAKAYTEAIGTLKQTVQFRIDCDFLCLSSNPLSTMHTYYLNRTFADIFCRTITSRSYLIL